LPALGKRSNIQAIKNTILQPKSNEGKLAELQHFAMAVFGVSGRWLSIQSDRHDTLPDNDSTWWVALVRPLAVL